MPELPEVERAAALIRDVGAGKIIERVETKEDVIVYSGMTHQDFAKEITGRKLIDARRYGKVFYFELEGLGKHPVLHFGMTGMLQVRGGEATYYQSSKRGSDKAEWPPRFMKFVIHFKDPNTNSITELAFMDARRLGRVRLCASPLEEPPISDLGFDPILSMPEFSEFEGKVKKRTCPIKALLLDQSFSAGVGNWVADEILYNAAVHPEQRCNTLNTGQLKAIHHHTKNVCEIAIGVNADSSKFPEYWLFKHRWGKGKKTKHDLLLPSGKPATIKWVTVGGRTSAYVVEVQILPRGTTIEGEEDKDDESEERASASKKRKRGDRVPATVSRKKSKQRRSSEDEVGPNAEKLGDGDDVGEEGNLSELTSLSDLEIEAEVKVDKPKTRSRTVGGKKPARGKGDSKADVVVVQGDIGADLDDEELSRTRTRTGRSGKKDVVPSQARNRTATRAKKRNTDVPIKNSEDSNEALDSQAPTRASRRSTRNQASNASKQEDAGSGPSGRRTRSKYW
ncbi:hypothetical protein AX16_000622 [Volvariella volvacea WC 439]|nr:hypothetical protein AX16_000622 [Volvariella volvacea WC 439]